MDKTVKSIYKNLCYNNKISIADPPFNQEVSNAHCRIWQMMKDYNQLVSIGWTLVSKQSKFLSLVLRHKPEVIGIALDRAGWVPVKTLLSQLKHFGRDMTPDELKELVETNDKKRFSFSEDGKKIRANQGHSVEVQLQYAESEPPEVLYHGTVSKYLDAIYDNGLQKMNRHHVHLSQDIETATKVGSRRGKPIILVIDSEAMYKDGYKFYLSENGVWLTDHVPSKYFAIFG